MVLLIDNYDSFSYNLYQLIGEIEPDIKVVRNNELTVDEVIALKPDRIILSPGPGRPEDAGIIVEVAKTIKDIPILGVCLGHQAICQAFGATVTYAKQLMHGKQSEVKLIGDSLIFKGLDANVPSVRSGNPYPDSCYCPTFHRMYQEAFALNHKHKRHRIIYHPFRSRANQS